MSHSILFTMSDAQVAQRAQMTAAWCMTYKDACCHSAHVEQ
jgi:hypothetical protein